MAELNPEVGDLVVDSATKLVEALGKENIGVITRLFHEMNSGLEKIEILWHHSCPEIDLDDEREQWCLSTLTEALESSNSKTFYNLRLIKSKG